MLRPVPVTVCNAPPRIAQDLELRELDAEFSAPGSTMTLETFTARREQIQKLYGLQSPVLEPSEPMVEPPAATTPTPTAPPMAWTKMLCAAIAQGVRRHVRDALAPVLTRLAAAETRIGALSMIAGRGESGEAKQVDLTPIEQRLRALEQALRLQYRGVFDQAKVYSVGNFATHMGSLWHANQQTHEIPGTDSSWTLAVKSGRDGKDAR